MDQSFPTARFSFSFLNMEQKAIALVTLHSDMSSQFSHKRLLQWNQKWNKTRKLNPAFSSMEACKPPESK